MSLVKRYVYDEYPCEHCLCSGGDSNVTCVCVWMQMMSRGLAQAKALGSLIKMYKQWAYDLYPGLNFEDFVDRTEALGKSHAVRCNALAHSVSNGYRERV